MVTFGQTISTVSEYAAACGSATLLRMDHAASMPITVVLPRAGGHLQRVAHEGLVALRLRVRAGLVGRHLDALLQVVRPFDQEDHRLGRLELGVEQWLRPVGRSATGASSSRVTLVAPS